MDRAPRSEAYGACSKRHTRVAVRICYLKAGQVMVSSGPAAQNFHYLPFSLGVICLAAGPPGIERRNLTAGRSVLDGDPFGLVDDQ